MKRWIKPKCRMTPPGLVPYGPLTLQSSTFSATASLSVVILRLFRLGTQSQITPVRGMTITVAGRWRGSATLTGSDAHQLAMGTGRPVKCAVLRFDRGFGKRLVPRSLVCACWLIAQRPRDR
jgi:hypothetical protein